MKQLFIAVIALLVVTACSKKNEPAPEPEPEPTHVPITITGISPLSAEIGAELTITGSGFDNDKSKIDVYFGDGIAVTPKSVTPTQIVVIVPETAKTSAVSVLLRFGKSNQTAAKSTQTFTPRPRGNPYVKTIGINMGRVAFDDDGRIIFAELYGGGNRVILKAGTGNRIELLTSAVYILPDVFDNGVSLPDTEHLIDNGSSTPLDTSGNAAVFKIKGFNRKVTGYDQLNLVMCKNVFLSEIGNVGYFINFFYLRINRKTRSNADYAGEFLQKAFSGDIHVSAVEIAKPLSENPIRTRDEAAWFWQCNYDASVGKTQRIDIGSNNYRTLFSLAGQGNYIGNKVKMEWVNADKATIAKPYPKEDDYFVTFDNIKKGQYALVIEPSDTVNHVFLRITGLDPEVCGYNQLRLFPAQGTYNGEDGQLWFRHLEQAAKETPSLSFIKKAFIDKPTNCIMMRHLIPHY